MDIEIWAPPTVSADSISDKLNEWMDQNPSKPPFTRFLQDHISSEWPVFWHLKIAHTIIIDISNRKAVSPLPAETDPDVDICSICHVRLDCGTERLACNHTFHTMCLHHHGTPRSTTTHLLLTSGRTGAAFPHRSRPTELR